VATSQRLLAENFRDTAAKRAKLEHKIATSKWPEKRNQYENY